MGPIKFPTKNEKCIFRYFGKTEFDQHRIKLIKSNITTEQSKAFQNRQ